MHAAESKSSLNGASEAAPRFGVAGFPPNFLKSDLRRNRDNIFPWLQTLGLDWIELQCTRGVKMKPEQARRYRMLAGQSGIGMSIHGPYFISLASGDADVVKRSRERVIQCFSLANELRSERIIFHPGYFPGNTEEDRRAAIGRIVRELNSLKADLPDGVHIFPETAGKISQIGGLDEILDICEGVDYARPCVDLAHVHAFSGGSLWTTESIENVFARIEKRLGSSYLDRIHVHMYPVDYNAHGEKKHKAFDDIVEQPDQASLFMETKGADCFYPRAEHFIEAVKRMDMKPVVICEAYNTQDVGAGLMKKLYYDNGERQ